MTQRIKSILPVWGLMAGLAATALATPSAPDPATAPAQPTGEGPTPMTDIHDILPPESVGMDTAWLLPVLIILAVIALLALAWWWKRRRQSQEIETIAPELPPEMIAHQALRSIADVSRMDGKTFYFRLSAILRQYVHGRFGVEAVEMTTEEFLPCIDELDTERELAVGLKQLCRAMDPVKFAGVLAVEQQMEADLAFAREFVEKTTRVIAVEELEDRGEKNPKPQISNLK